MARSQVKTGAEIDDGWKRRTSCWGIISFFQPNVCCFSYNKNINLFEIPDDFNEISIESIIYDYNYEQNKTTKKILIQLNNEICETISRGMFVTMLIGIYDINKKELLLSSAGHEPPIIFSKDGTFSNYNESGPPLGIMPKTKYTEHTIPFDNSSMYIFTDGITEIKNPKGEMLGSEGFQNYIQKYKDKPNNERLKIIIDDIF